MVIKTPEGRAVEKRSVEGMKKAMMKRLAKSKQRR